MDLLYARLHRWMAEPFVWGRDDCMLALADYMLDLTGVDVGDRWRGTYDSALSCQRASGFLTDPVKPVREGAERLGLAATSAPQRGDIGVIRISDRTGTKATGGICLGENWAVRAETGVTIGKPVEVLAAWSIPRA